MSPKKKQSMAILCKVRAKAITPNLSSLDYHNDPIGNLLSQLSATLQSQIGVHMNGLIQRMRYASWIRHNTKATSCRPENGATRQISDP